MPRRRSVLLVVLAAIGMCANDPSYRSVSIDRTGRLHIILDSGKEILPPKRKDQTSFGSPAIAPDRRTVGWLAMYDDPTIVNYKGAELPFVLVIFRAGRVLRTFDTDQIFWDWQFQDGGERVAYSTGPVHGEASWCILREVESGHEVARWRIRDENEPLPIWARTLRH